jgi:hypothetical protein
MSTPDVVKYHDPKSILLVNDKGQMKQVFTPFRVQCIEAVDQIPLLAIVYVDAVFMHKKHVLLYWINQRPYGYSHFRVQITW